MYKLDSCFYKTIFLGKHTNNSFASWVFCECKHQTTLEKYSKAFLWATIYQFDLLGDHLLKNLASLIFDFLIPI